MGAAVRPGAALAGGEGGVRNGFSQSPERLPASISRRGAEPRQGSIRPLISRAPEPSVSLVGEMEGDGGPGLGGNKGDAHPQQPRGSGSARGGHPKGMGQLPVVLQARGHPSSSPTPHSGTLALSARGVPRASVSPLGTGLFPFTAPGSRGAVGGCGSPVVLGSAPAGH